MADPYDYRGVNWEEFEKLADKNYRHPHTWAGAPPDILPKEITSQALYDYLYPENEIFFNPDFWNKRKATGTWQGLTHDLLHQEYPYNKAAGYSGADRLQRFFGLRIPPAGYLKNEKYSPYPVKKEEGLLSLIAGEIPTPNKIMGLYPHGILASMLMRILHGDGSNELR